MRIALGDHGEETDQIGRGGGLGVEGTRDTEFLRDLG